MDTVYLSGQQCILSVLPEDCIYEKEIEIFEEHKKNFEKYLSPLNLEFKVEHVEIENQEQIVFIISCIDQIKIEMVNGTIIQENTMIPTMSDFKQQTEKALIKIGLSPSLKRYHNLKWNEPRLIYLSC